MENKEFDEMNYNYSSFENRPVVDNLPKSYFVVQMVFAIVEIALGCFSPVAMVLGIIALVFAVQANTAYNQKSIEMFKSKSKTSSILLIIGGVFAVISIILNIFLVAFIAEEFTGIINEYGVEDEFDYDFEEEYDVSTEDELYGEQTGTDDVPLVEGFENFTLNGVSYSVPMSYSDFVTMGYVLSEEYDEEYVVEAESYEYFDFYLDEEYSGLVRISNDTKEALALKDCVVDYINFENPGSYVPDGSVSHLNLTFGNGFDMTTSYEELEEWLGVPYYQYAEEESGYTGYQWLYYGDDTYQNFEVTYMNGVISGISFEQYDYVY